MMGKSPCFDSAENIACDYYFSDISEVRPHKIS